MPKRFSWVIDKKLAGMERPGLFFPLEEDLEFLRESGIDVIVNLEEVPREYSRFEVKHIPIKDFGAPRLEDFEEFVRFVDCKIKEGKKVVVHCYAGMGRTNLMIASYLVSLGTEPSRALQTVEEKRPCFLVVEEQEEALWEYFYTIRPKENNK
jgi:atypical dual specificity phosphatase